MKPSNNIQNLINKNPTGTTFCFQPGTYNLTSEIHPRANDVLDGDYQKAILDGGNSTQYAINGDHAGGPSGVTVQGFKIQHFNTPLQDGAIQARFSANWIIQDNDIENNAAAGIATGTGVKVLDNKLDNNQEEGFAAQGSNILYQDNDISDNDSGINSGGPCGCVWGTWEAGGGKAWETTNLTFKNNTVNNNGGPGLWADTNNLNTTFEGNTVDNNWGAGILEEISYDFKIINNDVENNGTSSSQGGGQGKTIGWAEDAGIAVRESQGGINGYGQSMITGNTVYDNFNGISLIDSPASGCTSQGEGKYGHCKIADVTVQNNGVSMATGATGAYQDGSGDATFTSLNNTFHGNVYCVVSSSHPSDASGFGNWLQWMNTGQTWSSWQGYNLDTTGTYTVTSKKCIPHA